MAFSKLCTMQVRNIGVNFFARYRQDQLWKTIQSVSSVGRKKGRGTTRQKRKALENFYDIGRSSPLKISFPGLHGRLDAEPAEPIQINKEEGEKLVDFNQEMRTKIEEIKKPKKRRDREKLWPLERGFSGQQLMGQKLGPPPPYGEANFKGFNSYCIDIRRTSHTTKMYGRLYHMNVLAIVGNGDGLFGVGVGKSPMFKTNLAIVAAIKAASKRLMYINRLEDRTIYQDFFAECRNARVFAQRCAEGYGVVCHPRLQKICELVGIKDIYVKVEGTTDNYRTLTHAFLSGLMNQEPFEKLAQRRRMHVVELHASNQYMPKIIASPPKNVQQVKRSELNHDTLLKLDDFYGEGRMPLKRQPRTTFYQNSTKHQFAEWRKFPYRNMEKVMIRILADGIVPRWTRLERKAYADREHEMVMSGKNPMPRGIGLSEVRVRQKK